MSVVSSPHTKKTKENKRENRTHTPVRDQASAGTSSRRTLATYGVMAKQCATHCRDFPRHIGQTREKDQTPATRRRKRSTHQQGKNKKNEATRLNKTATPRNRHPRDARVSPTRACPTKTPTIEIAGAKQTNNENAVVKIP